MINEQDKQRIEKEAEVYTVSVESRGCSFWQGMYRGYVAGATAEHELLTPQLEYANSTIKKFSAELERSEKLLQEYREVIRELLPYAEHDYVQIVKYWGTESFAAATLSKKISRAKSLIEPKTDKA